MSQHLLRPGGGREREREREGGEGGDSKLQTWWIFYYVYCYYI